ncbi:hypothetical protein AXF42_Ash008509 [Apostasia shenzhenica]|uniref:Uncharacterized protein n=1 Tax=Apostasia shenzhenica TaxID=1088818 RepID=A0A2I0AY49_9ASPA|nr:hypothetical protein AXF42_Ash008509 [Apostasia shenzhenica]
MDRSGIPPAPPNSQAPPAAAAPLTSAGGHHNRSVSQPAFFSLDCLPPMSPSPYRKSSPTSSLSDSVDTSSPAGRLAGGDGLPPRKLHRRSSSDVPGFLAAAPPAVKTETGFDRKSSANVVNDFFEAFFNLDAFAVDSSDYRRETTDNRGSGTNRNGAYSSESEAESCAGIGDSDRTVRVSRHCRSTSLDGLMGRLNFGEDSPRVPLSSGSKRSQNSQEDSMDGAFSLEFGNGEFSGLEMKKIMADKRLEEIALNDPKRAKRCSVALHSSSSLLNCE